MAKKLSLLPAAIVVVAFAIPAFAQAAPELTIAGKKAIAGQTLTGTSTNLTMQSSFGLLKCSVATHGIVAANTGTTLQVGDDTTSGNTKGTGCTSKFSIENMTLTELHTTKAGSGTFKADFTGSIGSFDCQFSTAGSAFTYVPGASPLVITLTNVDLVGTPAACEPGTVNGSFTFTSFSGAVILH